MTIYILALHGAVTGGPEAVHQLSDALIDQGHDARLVYFRWGDIRAEVRFPDGTPAGVDWHVPGQFPDHRAYAAEYARYKVKLARDIPDEAGNVIVLPETAAPLAASFKHAKVLIWWLSVDYAFGCLSPNGNFCKKPETGELTPFNLNYLRRPNVYHAAQSRYAEGFAKALGLNTIGMLSDYTVDLTEYADPLPMSERPKLVAFNARADKVIADLPAIGEEIAKLDPEIRCIAIQGMPREEVAAIFAAARVYVDLGNFPGKDRMPREAARMGCAVAVAPAGAGLEATHNLAAWYDHTKARALLIEKICSYVAEPPPQVAITDERATFNTEVADVFAQFV